MNQRTAPRRPWPKEARLRRRAEFLRVYETGWRVSSKWFGAVCLRNPGQKPSRVGFAVPKGLGGSVIRNRIRRRLREAVRLNLTQLGNEWWVVLQARRAALEAPFEDLTKEVEKLFLRCARS